MTIRMRLPGVERILRCSLAAVDEAALARLVTEQVEESDQLDFKQEFERDNEELAKDICALANARGGLIVYGIKEASLGVAGELTPFTRPNGEIRQRIASILRSHTRPAPAFEVDVLESSISGSVFVVLAVPKSADAPHARVKNPKSDDPWLQFPMRREASTVFLSEGELATRYADRTRTLADRERQLDRITDRAHDGLPSNAGCLRLTISLTPVNAGNAPITDAAAHAWQRRSMAGFHGGDRSYGLSPGLHAHGFRIVARGIRLETGGGSMELYSDGSFVAAQELSPPRHVMAMDRVGNDAVAVDSEFLFVTLAGVLSFAAEFAAEAGCSGDMLTRIRMDSMSVHGTPRRLLLAGLQHPASGITVPLVSDCATLQVDARSMTSIELLTGTVSGTLVAEWHRLGSDITQALGLAEPHITSGDGGVRPTVFATPRNEQVASWAHRNGITATA